MKKTNITEQFQVYELESCLFPAFFLPTKNNTRCISSKHSQVWFNSSAKPPAPWRPIIGDKGVADNMLNVSIYTQRIFQILEKGGRKHRITQLAVYTAYIPGIYCLQGDYIMVVAISDNHRGNGANLGIAPLIINAIYTLYT